MPRLVWLVEIAALSELRNGKRSVLGELIIDSTASRLSNPILIANLPGVLIIKGEQDIVIEHDWRRPIKISSCFPE